MTRGTDNQTRTGIFVQKNLCPGISLWIEFNRPNSELGAFEEHISQEILPAGLDLRSCKVIPRRGKKSLFLFP